MSNKEKVRINKYIADKGICSRREADDLIAAGLVSINGKKAQLGQKVRPNDKVKVKGKIISDIEVEDIYIAFNKPVGIVTTTAEEEKNNIIDYINFPERIFPVGRLDKDSEGLILLTNDGEIVNKMMKSSANKEKEYLVEVNKPYDHEFVQKMENGVYILGIETKPAIFKPVSNTQFKLTITQGLNRQIRRMCKALGYEVLSLKRIRIMNITLGNLQPGEWREIGYKELEQLKSLL